jgi:acetyl esterase
VIGAAARRRLGGAVVDTFFRGAARLGGSLPVARPEEHGVERIRDLAYVEDGHPHHRLDVWRPIRPHAPLLRDGKLPVIVYVHGGGFRILDKDSHWLPALIWARRGYLVFNLSYRLAPAHPFPAAVQDVVAAWSWVLANAERWGGDVDRIGVAGESAGANLAATLALATVARRPEPWAAAAFDAGVVPKAVLPSMGLFQVSDPGRFTREKGLPGWLQDRIDEVTDAYLPGGAPHDLADPLLVLERNDPFERPLPPFHLSCGTADPLIDDTRRMAAALRARRVDHEVSYWPGGFHAFHMFVFRSDARRLWKEMLAFTHRRVAGTEEPVRPITRRRVGR